MEQSVIKERQQKQAYIVDNIDPNYYEDFHDFCTSYAGQIDIDAWSMDYVQELVAKFKDYIIKRNEEDENKHEKSFAIYQTTSGQNPIGKFENMQMNQILSSLQQAPPEPPKQQSKSMKKPIASTPEQNKPNQKAFAKKNKSQSKQKPTQNKLSAVDLLDSVFQQTDNKNKIDESKDQVNRSFFNSSNFWEVPKVDDQYPTSKPETKLETKGSPKVQPEKKQFKSIKLDMNVNQLNKNMKKDKQKLQPNKKVQLQPINNKSKDIQAFDYGKSAATNNNFSNDYFSINMVKPAAKNVSPDIKSQFDTFSEMADQEIKKKKSSIISGQSQITNNGNGNKGPGSSIKLKQVKELKPTSIISNTSSPISSISKIKQPYKGSRIFINEFVDHVSCVKSTIRPSLANENLKIQIKTFETIQRSIFSSNYLMYHMKVLPFGIVCKRNYEDFSRLRSILNKFYPGIQLPYLEKDSWRPDTSPQYAQKQAQMLQFFMTDILRNLELRNSRITEQFLSLQDHKKMKRKFQQYDRMTKLKSIEQLCLIDGKVQIALTQRQRIYNENMSKLIVKVQNNLQKYKKYCQTLSNQYNQAMQTMLNIDDIMKQIQTDIQNFNKNVTIREIQNLSSSLKKIRDNYKQNYFRMKFQKKTTDEDVIPFLRYEQENCNTSKDIIYTCQSLTNKYLKRMENENQLNSADSYLSEACNSAKNGILEQSKNLLVLKYQAGYMQVQASSQMQRILDNLGTKIDCLWKSIGSKYLQQLAKSVNTWSAIS